MIPRALQPYIKRSKNGIHTISKSDLLKVMEGLVSTGYPFLNTITGVDTGKNIEIIYHFTGTIQVNIRIVLPRTKTKIPSITEIVPAAVLYEREVAEMFNVEFEGHPDPRHLFLPDWWKGYPLRKEEVNKDA